MVRINLDESGADNALRDEGGGGGRRVRILLIALVVLGVVAVAMLSGLVGFPRREHSAVEEAVSSRAGADVGAMQAAAGAEGRSDGAGGQQDDLGRHRPGRPPGSGDSGEKPKRVGNELADGGTEGNHPPGDRREPAAPPPAEGAVTGGEPPRPELRLLQTEDSQVLHQKLHLVLELENPHSVTVSGKFNFSVPTADYVRFRFRCTDDWTEGVLGGTIYRCWPYRGIPSSGVEPRTDLDPGAVRRTGILVDRVALETADYPTTPVWSGVLTSKPGRIEIQAELHDADQKLVVRSQWLAIEVREPEGEDATALQWLQEHDLFQHSGLGGGAWFTLDEDTIASLGLFLDRFPNSIYAADVRYRVGADEFIKREWGPAVEHLRMARSSRGIGPLAGHALLFELEGLIHLGRVEEARGLYRKEFKLEDNPELGWKAEGLRKRLGI